MRKIVVLESVSLDGVMQAPGRADEDRRDGFRRTYQDFFEVWPNRTDNPFTAVLDNAEKFVASTTLESPLPWRNSTLLAGDGADAAARLKGLPGKDILVMGSGLLVQSLLRRGLVDVLQLLVHPLILGSGRRLLPSEGPPAKLGLVEARPTSTGVIIATYRREEAQ